MQSAQDPPGSTDLCLPSMPLNGREAEDMCMEEIRVFLKGAEYGTKRLKEVLPSLFDYYKIITSDEKATLLLKCGLTPYKDPNRGGVSFYFEGGEFIQNQFKAPKGYPIYMFGEASDGEEKLPLTEPYHEEALDDDQVLWLVMFL